MDIEDIQRRLAAMEGADPEAIKAAIALWPLPSREKPRPGLESIEALGSGYEPDPHLACPGRVVLLALRCSSWHSHD